MAAFDGLDLTYAVGGRILDRLTPVQRTVLAHAGIPLPWPGAPA